MEYQLSLFKKHGFKKFLLLTGYKSKMIENFLKRKNMLKNIKIVREKKKLGTGGALLNSVQFLDQEFCLIYGDILTNMNLKKMYLYFKKIKVDSCIVINKNNNYKDSNLLTIDKEKKVKNFYFYPHKKIPKNSYSNEAIFMFKKKFFRNLNSKNLVNEPDLVKNIFPTIKQKKNIYTFKSNELIIDCGTSERLKIARLKL